MIREAAALLSAACLAGLAGAAPPSSPSLLTMTLIGTVGDGTGSPIAGAPVRVFRSAQPAGSAVTDRDGSYRLEFGIDPEKDETVVVWWISPRTDLVSEVAIVRESTRDRELGFWGPCVPRIGAFREQTRDVRLLDAAKLRRKIADEGCAR